MHHSVAALFTPELKPLNTVILPNTTPPPLRLVTAPADTPSGVFEATFRKDRMSRKIKWFWASKAPLAALAIVLRDEFPVLIVGFVGLTCMAVPN